MKKENTMNYYSNDKDLIKSVAKLLGDGFSMAERVNFGVSYSQSRKLSVVVVELMPTASIHSLIFFYSRGMTLYDVVAFKNKRYYKVNRGNKEFGDVEKINQIVMKDIPKRNPINARGLDENDDSMMQLKDNQIQHLKDRLRIEQERSRSLRNQIKALRN